MSASRLAQLVALAREPSSERRRALLRELTDVFLDPAAPPSPEAAALYDEVATDLQAEMAQAARAEWAARLAPSAHTPYALAHRLSHDDAIAVAGPLLTHSPVLDEDALLSVARSKGQDHLRAVGARPSLPESVSEVVVERGDDETVRVLLANDSARLNRRTAEAVTDRAAAASSLQDAAVARSDLPPDLLNELYFAVSTKLRFQILQRNADLTPEQLDAAMAAGHERLARRERAASAAEEHAALAAARELGSVTPTQLAALLRRGERATVIALLSQRVDVPFAAVARVFDHADMDALAVLSRAANFDRALFLTFAVAVLENTPDPLKTAREYAPLYDQLTPDAADRVVRFWRLRQAA